MEFDVERFAFYAGFGDGRALIAGLRTTPLVLPLDIAGQIPTWEWGGLTWLVGFTSVERCRRYAEAAGRDPAAVEICAIRGGAVVDEILDRAPRPTGLVVDAASSDVMVFPPTQEFTPHCYVDTETGEAVKTW